MPQNERSFLNCPRAIFRQEKIEFLPPLLEEELQELKRVEPERFSNPLVVSDLGTFWFFRKNFPEKRLIFSELFSDQDLLARYRPKWSISRFMKEKFNVETIQRQSKSWRVVNYTPNCIYERLGLGCDIEKCSRTVWRWKSFGFYQKVFFVSKRVRSKKARLLELAEAATADFSPKKFREENIPSRLGIPNLNFLYAFLLAREKFFSQNVVSVFFAYNPEGRLRISRRYNVKFHLSESEVRELLEVCQTYKVVPCLVLNERPLSGSDFDYQKRLLKEAIEKFRIEHAIVSNPYLIDEFRGYASFTWSILVPVHNTEAADFVFSQLRADRIVLSRKLSDSETVSILKSFPDGAFEVFSEEELGCAFFEGYCKASHIFEPFRAPDGLFSCYRAFPRKFRKIMSERSSLSETKSLATSLSTEVARDSLPRLLWKIPARLEFFSASFRYL